MSEEETGARLGARMLPDPPDSITGGLFRPSPMTGHDNVLPEARGRESWDS